MTSTPVPNTFSSPQNLFTSADYASEQVSALDGGLGTFIDSHISPSVAKDLITTAQALVGTTRGKGIYATDESPEAMDALFKAAEEEQGKTYNDTERAERRKAWKKDAYEVLSNEHVSGVILYPETLHDFNLGPILSNKNIVVGVRANGELAPLPTSPFEFIVQGLDDLLPRLQAARAAGARFSKWRAPIACTSPALGLPSSTALDVQAETLAMFAAISQQAGLVPIIEPDVEFSADADLSRSVEIHEKIIGMIYARCREHGVLLEGSLIKPSFPQPGLKHPSRINTTAKDIALATATVISRSVPSAVTGVFFLSGGLPTSVAISYLSAVNALINTSSPASPFSRLPPLTFSYGRAIQGEAIKHWVKGEKDLMKASLEQSCRGCWKAARGE
ncbi:fructose-bisphosphate aldolase [Rhodocollybia butyracea]|uniref:fructose-bisphosphate aldolase n=1 Tax=Rhodocollybia butyracea TaxID=206335 RepID=A0A9P5U7D8_9AGAR|nr:fructose-bisphosphate aldolase [Rhodocollybia butyracea]